MSVQIGPLLREDWPAVESIYAQGIASGSATSEQSTPEWAAWNVSKLPAPRLVAPQGSEIDGWAVGPISSRPL